jgi:uncharacterized protein YecT (DUF1311 family)
MAARMLVFMLAGIMAACSSPDQEGRATNQGVATVTSASAPPVKVSPPEAKLRDSFEECVDQAAGATWPTQDCIEAEFEYQDARLNKDYRALMKALPSSRASKLRTEQRQWLSSRDADCPWDDDSQGQGRRIEGNYCVMERTALRADEFEAELMRLNASTH